MSADLRARIERAEEAIARLAGLIPLPDPAFRERFWGTVRRGEGCWEWQGRCQHNGYGRLWVVSTNSEQAAHRVAWQITYGWIPEGLFVLHRCDNPPCVRPDHLFLGTKTDNMRDCAAKGRNAMQQHPERSSLARPRDPAQQVRGERQGSAKLTEDQVRSIRRMRTEGQTSAAIAEVFNVSPGHVRKLCIGRAWAHLDLQETANTPETQP